MFCLYIKSNKKKQLNIHSYGHSYRKRFQLSFFYKIKEHRTDNKFNELMSRYNLK